MSRSCAVERIEILALLDYGDVLARTEKSAPAVKYEAPCRVIPSRSTVCQGARGRPSGRLVSGPDGIRTPRTWQPIDPWRSAQSQHAKESRPQGQIPGEGWSVLREHVADWFDLDADSPYMLMVAPLADRHLRKMTPEEDALFGIDKLNVVRSSIPAVTHIDYSARVQTVHVKTILSITISSAGSTP